MREIKFRVWNKATETIHYPDWDELATRAGLAEMEFTQYTGLKDKNGKEIYEGDIVKLGTIDRYFYRGIVEMKEGCWVAKTPDDRTPILAKFVIEVIGNIYENPELIGGGWH